MEKETPVRLPMKLALLHLMIEVLAQPAAVHDICNLSISKRHDIPLLEPRAQVLQSQHGWWTQKDGSNTHTDAIQVSYHGAALPCRRMVPLVYSG